MKGNLGKRLHDCPKLPCISNYIIELYSKYKMRKVNYDKGSQQQNNGRWKRKNRGRPSASLSYGMQLLNRAPNIETKVYIKPTNTGLLLHYQSHVDIRYKWGLLKTMLDRAYRLSSCWTYFSKECDRLKALFSRLKYPEQLINTTVRCFVSSKTEDWQPIPATGESPTVRIVLPFKDQDSADFVRKQLSDLSHKTCSHSTSFC